MSDIQNQIRIQKLARAHIRTLKPYSSARDEYEGKVGVFLDANENALGSVAEGNFNRYPDPHQRELKAELAKIKGVKPEQIFLGNGSDEAIDLLFRVFCEPKEDHVLLLPPTYGMYQVSADINQVKTVHIPLNEDFTLPVGEIIASIRPGTKMIFICSPNNPTGNSFSLTQIAMILKRTQGLVVVDEAYIDFSDKSSATTLLEAFPNLVVLQTFSKAWGMANLRLGMAYAHPEIIQLINKVKPPYNVNGLTQEKGLEAVRNVAKKEAFVETLNASRAVLRSQLEALEPIQVVYPSDANFLLTRLPEASAVYEKLIQEQVIVRNRSKVTLCEDCLRISVGTVEENQSFLQALKQVLGVEEIEEKAL